MASNLALSADDRSLYVVDAATADGPVVRTIDAETGALGTTYRLAGSDLRLEGLVRVAADRDAEHLHILDGERVLTLALANGQVVRDVPYQSESVAVFASWKHQLLLVADRSGKSVDVVWVGGGKLSYRIPIPGVPSALAANRAGTRLYAAVPGAARVPIIETEQYAVVDEIGDGLTAQRDVATSADAGRLYVLLDGDELAAYDLLTRTRLFTVPTPKGATRVVSDAAHVLVAGQSPGGAGWLASLDAATGQLVWEKALPGVVRDLIVRP
jgi:DNA-binding beta-propeller fold protein YncE